MRLWLSLLIPLTIMVGGVPDADAFGRAYALMPFLCRVPNLLVAELMLRRRGRSPVRPAALG